MERPRNLEGATDAEVDDPVWRQPGDLALLEANRAAVRDQGAREHVENRALAGPVRPDQAQNLALFDPEGHIVDGREAAKSLGEAPDGKQVATWAGAASGRSLRRVGRRARQGQDRLALLLALRPYEIRLVGDVPEGDREGAIVLTRHGRPPPPPPPAETRQGAPPPPAD